MSAYLIKVKGRVWVRALAVGHFKSVLGERHVTVMIAEGRIERLIS